ncbi:hypothetical protein AQS8620_03195 [Aquimixticola soesokkakensis]|uniref:Uncharacterized protein n=1 Tax=Aquimixticola soesokkakensis TaxID=1519096 RepID=A0A1Y5TTT4_9RHOB|nr:hypothetical protein [Aquimixticola soesokkakensis]SLN68122.1 hypothetical protein AQS8620_03195 [Aquimixticola soesokkakensis]
MQLYGAEVSGLTYNAATQAFEALVVFHENADKVSYPTELQAPINADFDSIARGLVLRARMRRARSNGTGDHDCISRLHSAAVAAASQGQMNPHAA